MIRLVGMVQKPGNLLHTSRLQQIKKGTDLLDQNYLFLSQSVVIICKDEKINIEPCRLVQFWRLNQSWQGSLGVEV